MAKKQKPAKKASKKANIPVESVNSPGFWSEHIFPVIILLALPFILYGASISYEYVLDDKIVISENQYVKEGIKGIGKIMNSDSFEGYFGEQKKILAGGRYRPLSLANFALEYEVFNENNPRVGHFFNILFYSLSLLLMYRVLLMLIPPLKTSNLFLSLPFVATLLFAMHPIHTEVVANIKGRDEILALLFCFGALYCSIKFIKNQHYGWLAATCVSLLFGILAKENGLAWLFVIPMSLYFFTKAKISHILQVFGALAITVVMYFGIRYNAIGYVLSSGEESTDIMNNPFFGLHIGEKAGTIMYTLGMYIKLLLYPHPLTHDYYPYQIPILGFDDWRPILSLLVNLGLLIYGVIGLFRKSIVGYGILFYFLTVFIVSNILVNIGTTMNERFVYMPSVGLVIILAYFIARWLPEKLNEKKGEINVLSVGILAILLLAYGAKTYTRVPDWKNPYTLNASAVKYSPNSARANCFMGVAIFDDYKIAEDEAIKARLLDQVTFYIDRSLELYPAYGSALKMKAGIVAEHYKKDYDIDRLFEGFTKVLQVKEIDPFINEYVEYLINQNREPMKLRDWLFNIGFSLNFEQRKSYRTALHYLNYAYQIDPNNENIIRAIGQSYRNLGDEQTARTYFQKVD